jgi:hypothetical protein
MATSLNPSTGTAASAPSTAPVLVDPARWSHHWRSGGPMPLAQLTSKWSHVTGGRQPGVSWQPVRDSNPCRHLERVSGAVRPVLSDDVAWSLNRDDGTRRAVSCRTVLANVVAFSTDSLAKSLASCRHTSRPSVTPHSRPARSASGRSVLQARCKPLPCLHTRQPKHARGGPTPSRRSGAFRHCDDVIDRRAHFGSRGGRRPRSCALVMRGSGRALRWVRSTPSLSVAVMIALRRRRVGASARA